jgi:hypothetical protein
MRKMKMRKLQFIQPVNRFGYVVEPNGSVYLLDNEKQHVKRTGLTKRQLHKNQIAYYWTTTGIEEYFREKEMEVFNQTYENNGYEFDIKQIVYSQQNVICTICYKFETSKDNRKEILKHTKGHYFERYGISDYTLSKFWEAVPQ